MVFKHHYNIILKGKKMKKNKGFTLIELLVTVVVLGILAGVGLPSYRQNVIKTNRGEAKAMLMDVLQREEKYFTEMNTYTTTLSNLGFSSANTTNGYYTVTVAANSNGITDGIIITATPQGNQANDSSCMNFILNSNGQKTVSTGATTGCW
jgi:type IV pilus assembly protein PilE